MALSTVRAVAAWMLVVVAGCGGAAVDPTPAAAPRRCEAWPAGRTRGDPRVAACWREAMERCELAAGEVTVAMVVRDQGDVSAAAAHRSTVGPELTSCAVRAAFRWRFPARVSADGFSVIRTSIAFPPQ